MAYGFFFIDDYTDVIAMGVLLGIAGCGPRLRLNPALSHASLGARLSF